MRLSHAVSDEALGGSFDLPGDDPIPIYNILSVDSLGQLCPLVLAGLPEPRAGKPEVEKVCTPFLAQEGFEQLGAFPVVQEGVKWLGPLQVRRGWWSRALRFIAQVQVRATWGRRRRGGCITWRVPHFRRQGIACGLGKGVWTGADWLDWGVHVWALLTRNRGPRRILCKVGRGTHGGHNPTPAPVPDPMQFSDNAHVSDCTRQRSDIPL